MVAIALACRLFWFTDKLPTVTSTTVVILVVLAGVGELVEFVTGAAGVGKLGGSKRAAVLAIAGSMVGAVVGLLVGSPIPVVGSLVASLLLGGAGACAGAALGERWAGKEWDGSIQVGVAAFWGRLLGTVGKVIIGFVILLILIIAFCF